MEESSMRVVSHLALLFCLLAPSAPGQPIPRSHEESHEDMPAGRSPTERATLVRALDAARHEIVAAGDHHRARNPAQRWTVLFDGRGFTAAPDAGGWSWGLELTGYGRRGDVRPVSAPRAVHARTTRLAYEWDDTLTEWYVNDEKGLEHGYTLSSRPEGDAPLVLDLATRGPLAAAVERGGRDVLFANGDGDVAVTYTGLVVYDATGDALEARFDRTERGLRLAIDDRGARYPLTVDPIAQQAYLKASNTGAGDHFGWAIAVSGDTVVVGAPFEDSAATGVDGDPTSNAALDSGAAYVFVRNGNTWTQQAYLKASNTDAADHFGRSVAISGDTIVVGAPNEDGAATGVNGDPKSDAAADAGAAYVFVRSGTTWTQQAYLKASNTEANDQFGGAVAIDGDTVVVGAVFEDGGGTGAGGDPASNAVPDSGAAYVFARSGTAWTQQAYLKASNTGLGDGFGRAVAISGDTVVVGAPFEDSAATGPGGDQNDDSAFFAGAAYAFVRAGTVWTQQAYLKASNTGSNDQFGGAVAISGDTLAVGAAGEDSDATGPDGDQTDDDAADSGAVYVFARTGTVWTQQAYLKASNTDPGDGFGTAVAVEGDRIAVGAPSEDSAATSSFGDPGDDSALTAGAAYAFVRQGTTWAQQGYIKAFNAEAGDQFGGAVAILGDAVFAGAAREAGAATGTAGNPSSNGAFAAGAAYVFDLDPDFWIDLGAGLAGTNGTPVLAGTGSLVAGTPTTLVLTDALPASTSVLIVGLTNVSVPFLGGTLVPSPDALIIGIPTGPGTVAFSKAWPSGVAPGTSFFFQYWISDPGGPAGFAASNAVTATAP